jgi:nucleoside-diphosphate-sugar epimerase
MTKRILITGSSGFIGKHLTSHLIGKGHRILGIDKKVPSDEAMASYFQHCDILDVDRLNEIVLDFSPEVVIHLAARIDLDEKNDLNGYAANIQGVENLILAIRNTPSVKRAIFTSSQLVCMVGYIPKTDKDYRPNTLYGQSKVLTERIVRENNGGDVEWCILRPTTIWGEGMSPHYQRFLKMVRNGQYFHISNRPLYKSYGYIGNSIYQYEKIMDALAEQIHKKTFYIADYEPLSLRNWVKALENAFGVKEVRTYPKIVARAAAKAGDMINILGFANFPFNSFRLNNILTEYIFDLSETQKVCGDLPFTMEEGVDRTVSWLIGEGIVTSKL